MENYAKYFLCGRQKWQRFWAQTFFSLWSGCKYLIHFVVRRNLVQCILCSCCCFCCSVLYPFCFYSHFQWLLYKSIKFALYRLPSATDDSAHWNECMCVYTCFLCKNFIAYDEVLIRRVHCICSCWTISGFCKRAFFESTLYMLRVNEFVVWCVALGVDDDGKTTVITF